MDSHHGATLADTPHLTIPRLAVLAFGLASGVLMLSFAACPQEHVSSDTVTHPLTAWSLLEGRGGHVTVEDLHIGAWATPPQIYMLEAQNGELVTGYGVGVATALVPAYAAMRALGLAPQAILANRTSQAIALLLMIVAVGLVYATAARFTSPHVAAFAAVAMALGSPVLSLLSRGLWQQTALTFAFALACWLVFRPGRELPAGLLLLAGAIVGWTAAVRPTAAIYCLLWTWAVWRLVRLRAWLFVAPIAAWVLATAAYQWTVFGRPWLSGQPIIAMKLFGSSGSFFQNPLEGLVGVLFSPGVGLLVFSPLFLFVGRLAQPRYFWAAGGNCLPRRVLRDLALLCVAGNLLFVSLFRKWWGGWGYGPRYPSDNLVFLVLALALALDASHGDCPPKRRRGVGVWAVILLTVPIFLHGAGLLVNPYGAGFFNRTFDIDNNPEVVWDWRRMPSLFILLRSLDRPAPPGPVLPDGVT